MYCSLLNKNMLDVQKNNVQKSKGTCTYICRIIVIVADKLKTDKLLVQSQRINP